MTETIAKKIALLKAGQLSEEDFLETLKNFPYENMGNIKLDFHRQIRRGLPEVIYGSGKSIEQLEKIAQKFTEVGEDILITRIDPGKFEQLESSFPNLIYHPQARIVTFDREPQVKFKGTILVLSAGSSDEYAAEEAYVSARYLGNNVEKEYDVGIACLSRILDLQHKLNDYSVLIVTAGMEGALPSVVAGLTATPIIAVPTAVGYGANFGGLSALLAMLNACSGGVSVVNIDNGFGAAFQATLINRKISR
ncbi:MAG: nickel pincer cofactor biosynthesis protein LarB [Candidatus Aminicenantes bacterium]|nr:nickel pincer cofactor biosynthesis protein LarB [Candidatus Aminicenantes bacterium]